MFVRDLNGNEYPLQATTTHDFELNGNQLLSFTITPSKVNDAFIENFSEMWEVVDDQDVAHKVLYARKRGEGKRLTVDVKATPLFFDALDMDRIYEERNEHMTAMAAFNYIFYGTDFEFVITGSFAAVQWEGFGNGQTRLATFKRAIERYGAEFELNGNVVTLANQVGRDTSFMYRHQLNASNIVQEIDATQLWTYAKGFGNFAEGEEENALLVREYTSPLAAVVGIRHAPPIYNGSITTIVTMDAALKTLVDNSLQISVSTDVHDLRKQGYPLARPELGDRVFLMDERIGLDEEVRINSITVVKDWLGNVLDLKLVIGSESLVKRHQSSLTAAVDRITDVLDGRAKLPSTALDNAILAATKAIQSAQTELSFENGLTGVDPDNPNYLTRLTSRGLGVSDDGGATFGVAVHGGGVVAEYIVAGTMRGMTFESESADSRMWIQGGDIRLEDLASGQYLNQNSRGFTGFNAAGDILFQANQTWVTTGIVGTTTTNFYMASYNEARAVHIDSLPGNGAVDAYTYIPFRADGYKGNYLDVNTGTGATNLYLRPALMGEVRVTAGGTIDVYYPLRAANIHGSAFISTVANAWIGADDELRVMDKALSGDYKDVRARGYFGTFMTADEGLYVYMGTDLGLRVTSRGLASAGPIYRDVTAASFSNGSRIESKENIELWTADALALINGSDLTTYHLKGDLEQERVIRKYGLVLGGDYRAPQEVVNGDGIDQYAMTTVAWRAIQQLSEEVAALKAELGATT